MELKKYIESTTKIIIPTIDNIQLVEYKNKELDWHDDFRGTLVVDNKNYWINVRKRSDTWMTGTVSPMEEKSLEQEPKKEIKEEQTDTVHEDLDDEIPF